MISTTIIATILHELAHFAVASYYNMHPTLHHNFVRSIGDGVELHTIYKAAAGPLFSLLLGVIFLPVSIRLIKPSLTKLFFLWFGMNNLLIFLGYLLIAPIARDGDTGKVFYYIGVPLWLSVTIAVASMLLINFLFSGFAKQFVFYKQAIIFDKVENKRQLLLYPILFSMLMMTVLSLPIPTWVSLLPTFFLPMTYFSTLSKYKKISISDAPVLVDKYSIPLASLLALTICIFRYLAY